MPPALPVVAAFVAGVLASGAPAGDRFAWPGALPADARAALGSPEAQRLRAIEQLGASAEGAATPFLIPLLADADPGVRLYAARRLSRSGEPAATSAAIAWVLTPTIPQVDRPFGLEILRDGAAFPAAAREAVERALRDPEAGIRSQALDALERHDPAPSLPAVLAALDDDNREVRLRAVRLAGAVGAPRAALPLLARLEDSDHQVRLEAIRALGAHPRAAAALLRLAAEGSDDARLAAVDALGATPGAATEAALAGFAGRRPADDLARHAQLALGRLGTPAATAALIAVARMPPVSDETKAALRRLGPAAVPALVRELHGGSATSVVVAAAALADIGDRRATAPLAAAVDRRPDAAAVLLEALAKLGDPAALPALARAAESPGRETRLAAFDGLVALGDARAGATVDRGLADPDPAVRARAARLAAATGASAATPALASLMAADREPAVRGAAAAALARVGRPARAAFAEVLAALRAPGAPPRDAVEWRDVGDALARLADPADRERLGATLLATQGPGRVALMRALAATADGKTLPPGLAAALVTALAAGGPEALAAADALGAAPLPDGVRAPLAAAFAAAEPAVQARLCPAVARISGGGPWLGALVADRAAAAEVRAAAAWAARGLAAAAPALAEAAREGDGPVPANARAARTVGGSRSAATEVRLRAPDGGAEAGRWISLSAPGGVVVWTVTDEVGAARVEGLPDGPVALQVPEASLRRDGP
jgi:HEAT repeat protein